MAAPLVVECPSGLVVALREFKVKDEDLLANPRAIRKGVATTDLLEAITLRVDEAGPYRLRVKKEGEDPQLDWGTVLQGDRMVVLLLNRIHTWGSDMVFEQPCPNCRSNVKTQIDLHDLEIKPLPKESRAHVDQGTPITVTLPGCGTKVGFRLLRGKDDRGIQKIQKSQPDERSSAYLRFRIVDVEGVPQPEWGEWLRELGGRDSSFLRAAFDQADCGVDQEVEFECVSCDHYWSGDVNFRADFFFPKYRGKTTNRT